MKSWFDRVPVFARRAAIGLVLLGCSADALDPIGPGGSLGMEYYFVLLGRDTLHGDAGDLVNGARVLVLGPNRLPAAGTSVEWRVLSGGGRVDQAWMRTDASGVATTTWFLGPHVAAPQVLRLKAGERDSVLIYATAGLPSGVTLSADSSLLGTDTIGTELPSPVQLTVQLPDGRPIIGALVDFSVARGGGLVTAATVATDSQGTARTRWQLGDSAGAQEVVATVRPAIGEPAQRHSFRALSLPGTPTAIIAGVDTIRFYALQDTAVPPLEVRDRAGNRVISGIVWSSLTPEVVGDVGGAGVTSLQNGVAQIAAHAGPLSVTIPAVVSQQPRAVRFDRDSVSLQWIGATTRLDARVLDRRGIGLEAAKPVLRNLAGNVATLDSTGMLRAIANGSAHVVAEFQGLADTLAFTVAQAPAAITVTPALDTMELDEAAVPSVAVFDSGGTPIAVPSLVVSVSDSSVIGMDPDGTLRATLPGVAILTYRAGPVAVSIRRVVEGVAILWDGRRVLTPGPVTTGRLPLLITNGRVRLSWPELERAAVTMQVRLGDTWHQASSPQYGDWLYITSGVLTLPTEVAIVEITPDRIGFRTRYADHWFLPQNHGYPESFVAQPYPFDRTLWLSKRENGYYSWVDLYGDVGSLLVEHETGFGGLWGPATIRTSQVEIRTDTLQQNVAYNGDPRSNDMGSAVDAAEFIRDGDPVRRVLVPVPQAPFITPVFPGWGYGAVWRYAGAARSFGVYMYADDVGAGPSVPTICQGAWRNAPFPVPAVTDAQLTTCGPSGP